MVELEAHHVELKVVPEPHGTSDYDDLRRAENREPLASGHARRSRRPATLPVRSQPPVPVGSTRSRTRRLTTGKDANGSTERRARRRHRRRVSTVRLRDFDTARWPPGTDGLAEAGSEVGEHDITGRVQTPGCPKPRAACERPWASRVVRVGLRAAGVAFRHLLLADPRLRPERFAGGCR
jgi:hypothetical protein